MSQSLFVVFPLPVVLAFAALVLLLLAVVRVLAGLCKPVAVRIPGGACGGGDRLATPATGTLAELAELDAQHG